MLEYLNPHQHELRLLGPKNQIVKIPPKGKVVLLEWFKKYCPQYLTVVNKPELNKKPTLLPTKQSNRPIKIIEKSRSNIIKVKPNVRTAPPVIPAQANQILPKKQPKIAKEVSVAHYVEKPQNEQQLDSINYEGKIGVGILSFNRLNCIKRLLESIYKFTDLNKVTIFVSDESTDEEVISYLKTQTNINVATNQPRLGVAGNSNRLLKSLNGFEYCLLLNDDVEVLNRGWEKFYVKASIVTRYNHFCYRQIGIYGANVQEGIIDRVSGVKIRTISRKPHGAVMFFTHQLFEKVGYFDTKFPKYGLEHTDWSERAARTDLVPRGFHDVVDSNKYFRIHNDKSSAPNNKNDLIHARQYYNSVSKNQSRIYIQEP